MASEHIVTLYDVASCPDKPLAWNTMVLKARYSLNYKGIPHRTIWLEYPDIEQTMRSIGAAPTATSPEGRAWYTLPVIVDPSRPTHDGRPTVVSDSWAIAEYLDNAYPDTQRLIPDGTNALQMHFQTHAHRTLYLEGLAPILIPQVMPYLNEASRPYWRETREAYFGKKLEELCPKGSPIWEKSWKVVQKAFDDIAASLENKNGASPLVMGDNVNFSDFVIVSMLDTIHLMLPEEWDKVKTWNDGKWGRLRDRCAAWRSVH